VQASHVLHKHPHADPETIKRGLEGNLCRCTGYHNIVKAVLSASGQEVSA
jgi:carbon-monoxide dehydrogenase small subunit